MGKVRIESDSMGQMEVPSDALYGPQSARASQNFPISGWTMPRPFISAIGLIKLAAAQVHKDASRLSGDKADAIIAAAQEVVDGKHDEQFIVDVFQTGSGTSTNMNANEIIANRAVQIFGGQVGNKTVVHPNDDVNQSQSSNDVIPTALHVSAAISINKQLVPALIALRDTLRLKAEEFDSIVKIGRTHLMDAVPIRLGQEFSGYAAQIDNVLLMLADVTERLCDLAIGGTAVGTGLNAPAGFASEVCRILADRTTLAFRETANHYEAQAARDAALYTSGVLKVAALAMSKAASDIRLLGSGPRCGIGELILPALQPGSSIMPGKVNPVICESVVQVACQVVGCDAAITAGATGGVGSILDLNVAMPMIAANLLTAIRLLTNVANVFNEKCVLPLRADEQRCAELVEKSLAMVTVLAPRIGYDAAATIAKEAHASGQTIRELCIEKAVLSPDELTELLDAMKQTGR